MFARLGSARYAADRTREIGAPALCLVGSADDLMPPAVMRHVASILGARCIEIDGAGHSPYFERPEQWNEPVARFIDAVAASSD
jgi:pimeloyl-ACP methyl ester carboxylesterase